MFSYQFTGTATYSLGIPSDPSFLGATMHMQGAVFDSTANALGAAVSPGASFTFGSK